MPHTFIDPNNFNEEMGHDSSFTSKEEELVSWIVTKVDDWERYRDQNYEEAWEEYYRLWRGIWAEEDKSRDSERSKLISPAIQQAVEATKSELEEAALSDGLNFDISDNYADERTDFQSPEQRAQAEQALAEIQQLVQSGRVPPQQGQILAQQVQQQVSQRQTKDVEHMKNLMQERFDKADIATSLSKIFLNGCLYGTGIGKVVPEVVDEKRIVQDEDGMSSVEEKPTVYIYLEAVSPSNFVIDPAATSVDEALGCAHVVDKPLHEVEQKQSSGIYKNVSLGNRGWDINDDSPSKEHEDFDTGDSDTVRIIEWSGLVPKSLLEDGMEDKEREEAEEYVEAIVTIANDSVLLRAMRSPYLMEDRPFIAYQHSTVPDVFWGRGVVEQGYNPQKALDAELRSRMDGLALSVHPMLAMDATKRVRGTSYTVSPGKTVFTNGEPKNALMPFNFGDINSKTFQNAGDLERMVQMATGAMDSAAPVENNRRNETASGMSMIMGGAIKRSKQTLRNIENNLIKPLLNKAGWRFMQFNPDEFPMKDLNFLPHSSLGIMARELEQQQLVQLLNVVPQESPAFYIILKSIYENSSLDNREELIRSINQMMQPDPSQQQIQQIQVAHEQAKLEQTQTAAAENRASAYRDIKEAQKAAKEASLEEEKLDTQIMKDVLDIVAAERNARVQQETTLAQETMKAMQGQQNTPSQED